jgi:hypothetical protein
VSVAMTAISTANTASSSIWQVNNDEQTGYF